MKTRGRFVVGDEVKVVEEGDQCIYPGYNEGIVREVLSKGEWYRVALLNFCTTWYEDFQLEKRIVQ